MHPVTPAAPATIGVFDSGVGGLSVLRHIHAALPAEHLVYLADAGFAPYGDKPETLVAARALAIAGFLIEFGAKALVVACNTATAVAIESIRARYPAIPVVGVEPGLKPAAEVSLTKTVGVLATSGTLASARFAQLQSQITAATGVRFILQPCPGLADQIEKGELRSPATARRIEALVRPLLDQGADALVLGCTHYPFIQPLIEATIARRHPAGAAARVTLIDTGDAVARQLEAVLRIQAKLRDPALPGTFTACTTGSRSGLSQALRRLLGVSLPVTTLVLNDPIAGAMESTPRQAIRL